jgi:hypothetical protein
MTHESVLHHIKELADEEHRLYPDQERVRPAEVVENYEL